MARDLFGVLDRGRWYCDYCQAMGAPTGDEAAQRLLAEHLAEEGHIWRAQIGRTR